MRPVYSPDGKKIALVNNDGSSLRIALFDVQTSTMKFLTEGPLDESPAFAPNGNLMMYTRIGDSGGTELATVSIDGQIRRSVRSLGSEVREPAWSSYIW
jgi:TolB protein